MSSAPISSVLAGIWVDGAGGSSHDCVLAGVADGMPLLVEGVAAISGRGASCALLQHHDLVYCLSYYVSLHLSSCAILLCIPAACYQSCETEVKLMQRGARQRGAHVPVPCKDMHMSGVHVHILLFMTTNPVPRFSSSRRCLACGAGRADYFGLVLNRAARVQGTAFGGQVLAEGIAVDKAAQEWRMLYPQKPTGRSSRSLRCMPGMVRCLCRALTAIRCQRSSIVWHAS
jgi:hypothetical protein